MKKYNEIYFRPVGMNMVEDNGKVWMALLNRNGICEIDRKTKHAEICQVFNGEELNKGFLYCCVEKVSHYLIFSPCEAKNIAVYDLNQKSLKYIPLNPIEHKYKENQDGTKFWNVFRYRSDVYLLGYSYPAIIKIDIEADKVIYITDWLEEVEKNIREGNNRGYFGDGHVISNGLALLPIGCMNAVLELDLKTTHTKIRKLSVPMEGIGGLSSADGKNVWLVGKGSNTNWISCWNRQADSIKGFQLEEEDANITDPFYAPICLKSKVFLIPASASHTYEIDVTTNEVSKSKFTEGLFENVEKPLWPRWKTISPKMQGDWLTFLTCSNLKWHEYNVVTGKLRNYFIHWEEGIKETELYFDSLYSEVERRAPILPEERIPLEYFINKVIKENMQNLSKRNELFLSGRKIYDQVSRNI